MLFITHTHAAAIPHATAIHIVPIAIISVLVIVVLATAVIKAAQESKKEYAKQENKKKAEEEERQKKIKEKIREEANTNNLTDETDIEKDKLEEYNKQREKEAYKNEIENINKALEEKEKENIELKQENYEKDKKLAEKDKQLEEKNKQLEEAQRTLEEKSKASSRKSNYSKTSMEVITSQKNKIAELEERLRLMLRGAAIIEERDPRAEINSNPETIRTQQTQQNIDEFLSSEIVSPAESFKNNKGIDKVGIMNKEERLELKKEGDLLDQILKNDMKLEKRKERKIKKENIQKEEDGNLNRSRVHKAADWFRDLFQ